MHARTCGTAGNLGTLTGKQEHSPRTSVMSCSLLLHVCTASREVASYLNCLANP